MKSSQKYLSVFMISLSTLLAMTDSFAAVTILPNPGSFQVVTSGDGTRAWRINTLSGEMLYCSPEEDSELPVCRRVEIPVQAGQGTAPGN